MRRLELWFHFFRDAFFPAVDSASVPKSYGQYPKGYRAKVHLLKHGKERKSIMGTCEQGKGRV
jgi:hypothetical protein